MVSAWDRDVGAALFVDGELVATVDFERHGSEGEELLHEVGQNLARIANVVLVQDQVSDDEFREMIGDA